MSSQIAIDVDLCVVQHILHQRAILAPSSLERLQRSNEVGEAASATASTHSLCSNVSIQIPERKDNSKAYQNTILKPEFVLLKAAAKVQPVEKIASVVAIDTNVLGCLKRQRIVLILEENDTSGAHLADELAVLVSNIDGRVVVVRVLEAVVLLCDKSASVVEVTSRGVDVRLREKKVLAALLGSIAGKSSLFCCRRKYGVMTRRAMSSTRSMSRVPFPTAACRGQPCYRAHA